ncbi:hypothetical protein B5X24_HaOG206058 [Helicoverpa armigera]|uniref:C2H2-type domain-containing protein n=1 Tax=Helicoverpa armigera TaxID=29058 RepID=A0A2W1BK83_HELAM|nr:hypothetical protein B5X24_HaOG206058 [Helicoverpa armigera]
MTSFSHLNMQECVFVPDIADLNSICICCNSQNALLLTLSTCKHSSFLTNDLKLELDLTKTYICVFCHHNLKKIEKFKQQVAESVALLLDQTPALKINRLHNLKQSTIEITSSEQYTFKAKPDLQNENSDQDCHIEILTDVKIEYESSDETEIPLSKLKKEKEGDKYEGKIAVIILSEEELREERVRMSKNEKYLKLPFKCETCVVGFDHEVSLVSHMDKRHKKVNKNSYQCNICKSILSTKPSYYEHTRRHFRRLECMVCHKRYNHMQSAVQHYDEQHAPVGAGIQRGYTCKECGFTTTLNRAYRYHMDKHKEKQSCNICGASFVSANGLKVHMLTVHQQSSRVYKCEYCNKQYSARSGYEAHQRSVHGEPDDRGFCVECKTHFRTKKGLAHHLSTHSRHVSESDKRFICDECGAKFVTKTNLQVHINWEHLKINTHKCSKCTKVFKSRSDLNRHVTYVHLKKRPPRNKICDYCGRGFTTQTILQCHIRTHTGERPLQCAQCSATFAHSAALYTHTKLIHKSR